ncbi:DUF4412 domain-containing protein [Nitrospirales bacterium NOB]|nr:DUF4412 domain-containing protein [Nitrospira sp. NTP2]MDL1890219.1 DUF4412 domain-containing protein [Nitrospirales bacterium NOB]QOJ37174.1 MAG: DUF4412 domain-containing protein [Nitrospira sp.]RIK61193.1 MAG: hypothetical protein DCC63_00115 [Nitrospira sp.]
MYLAKEKDEEGSSELCIGKGLGNAALFALIAGDASTRAEAPVWLRELVKDGGFPLRTIDRDSAGREESRSEATKVEAQPLDDGLFTPLPGFTRIDLDAVMQSPGEDAPPRPPSGERE